MVRENDVSRTKTHKWRRDPKSITHKDLNTFPHSRQNPSETSITTTKWHIFTHNLTPTKWRKTKNPGLHQRKSIEENQYSLWHRPQQTPETNASRSPTNRDRSRPEEWHFPRIHGMRASCKSQGTLSREEARGYYLKSGRALGFLRLLVLG